MQQLDSSSESRKVSVTHAERKGCCRPSAEQRADHRYSQVTGYEILR